MKKDSAFYCITVLTLICLVSSLLLSLTNQVTGPAIAEAEAAAAQAALLEVMPDAVSFETVGTEGLPASIREVFRDTGGGGYVFRIETSGFAPGIAIMCAIGTDGKIIRVKTLSCNETDGYGKQCEEDWYQAQYTGCTEDLPGVDGISGATKTSNGYRNGIRDAFTAFSVVAGR